MEINEKNIIKGLDCCTRGRKDENDRPCLDCPYNECNIVDGTSERQTTGTCQGWLMKDALALIKELTEENEYLKSTDIGDLQQEYDSLAKSLEDAIELIDKLRAKKAKLSEENERLHTSCTELAQCCTKLETLYKIECKRVDTIRADTVRKMQERLKQVLHDEGRISYYSIDKIAKEMLEGEK